MKGHIIIAFSYLLQGVIPALIIYLCISFILIVLKKRKNIKMRRCFCEYISILYVWTILEITGIIGMEFNIQWFKQSMGAIGFGVPQSVGELQMFCLNVGLFVPFGILMPIVFFDRLFSGARVIISATFFSLCIEVLQMFAGRFFEINDILANSIGAILGFCIYYFYNRVVLIRQKKNKI